MKTATAVLVCIAASSVTAGTTVSWDDVRQTIGETICLRGEPHAPAGYRASWGDRKRCGLEAPATPIERAVDAAFRQSQPLMVGIQDVFSVVPIGLDEAYAAETPAERNRLAARAFLAHEPFLRVLLPRLRDEFENADLTCDGCPKSDPPALRKPTWREFSPYVSAFILPHPDARSFHLCSGADALRHVAEPDPDLLRAGFLVANRTGQTRKLTAEALSDLRNDPTFRELPNDASRTAALHEEVVGRFQEDPELLRQACQALAPYTADLGFVISDCPPAP